ncbi:MAG: Bug family tripartite tricarboxylate transporter substrate binding protein [Xanthobacteraceae bacterium]
MSDITRRVFVNTAASAGAALAGGLPALAQGGAAAGWPDHPVRFIVPLAPGGAIDFIARAVGEVMTRQLGQQIVVENRTGAGGTLGMDLAMKSPPDGYTVLITNDNAASAPHVMNLSYDYTKELLPACYLGRHGQILAAHSSLNVNTVAELVTYVKANPGIGLATSGVGSNQHVLCEWFKREADIKIEHVPYRGAGQAVNDLIAGHVKIAFLGPTSLIPHWQAGTIKLLAQSSAKRGPTLPDVPTLEEAGYKGLVLEAWYGAFVPNGTPPELVTRLNAEMNKALKDTKLVDTFTKGAIEPVGGEPEDIGKLARADSEKYARLVKELGIKMS